MLIFQIKRIIRITQVKNGLTMSLLFLFFLENAKNLGFLRNELKRFASGAAQFFAKKNLS